MADALRTRYKPPAFHRQIITSVKPYHLKYHDNSLVSTPRLQLPTATANDYNIDFSNYLRLQLQVTPTNNIKTYHQLPLPRVLLSQPTASNTLPSPPATAYHNRTTRYCHNQLQTDSTTTSLRHKRPPLPIHPATTTTTTATTIPTMASRNGYHNVQQPQQRQTPTPTINNDYHH